MCGRYTITQDLAELEKLVKFICKIVDFKPRYNIAPRSIVPVLVSEKGQTVLSPSGSKPARDERFKTGHFEVKDSYHFWFSKQGISAAS